MKVWVTTLPQELVDALQSRYYFFIFEQMKAKSSWKLTNPVCWGPQVEINAKLLVPPRLNKTERDNYDPAFDDSLRYLYRHEAATHKFVIYDWSRAMAMRVFKKPGFRFKEPVFERKPPVRI